MKGILALFAAYALVVGAVLADGLLRARNRGILAAEARRAGVPESLLLGVGEAESGCRSWVRSRKGALGLLQLMPATAAETARKEGMPSWDLEDPRDNARLGAAYLAGLLRRFRDPHLALAAYHAGPSRVEAWMEAFPGGSGRQVVERMAFPVTREYVRAVMARAGPTRG